jgi:hypothetical protein
VQSGLGPTLRRRSSGCGGNNAKRLAQCLDLGEGELVGGQEVPDPAGQLNIGRGQTYMRRWQRMRYRQLAGQKGGLAAHAHLGLHEHTPSEKQLILCY